MLTNKQAALLAAALTTIASASKGRLALVPVDVMRLAKRYERFLSDGQIRETP